MNYAEIRLALRPRTLFEILDLSLIVLRRSAATLWPLYAGVAVVWIAVLLPISLIPEGPDRSVIVFFILLLVLLLLRFILQMTIVIFCGRWIFSEDVTAKLIWEDLKQIGFSRMIGRGLFRFLKWISGFLFLIPLWIVLVHRFFDYEHWLLERIGGRELRQRLRNFRSGRVFAFRILHLVYQLLFLFLGSFAVEVILESVTRKGRPESTSIQLYMTLLLLYEPFFLISRFLFYIQTRIDTEAWDIGLMLREGIRRTMASKAGLLLILVIPFIQTPHIVAEEPIPYITGEANRDCTEAMQKQGYVQCNPTAYRVYSAEEIEKTIPRERQRSETDTTDMLPSAMQTVLYSVLAIALAALLFFIWNRYRNRRPDAPVEASGKTRDVQEFEVIRRDDRLALIRDALEKQSYRKALGHSYLLLMERNERAGTRIRSLTPDELRQSLRAAFPGQPLDGLEGTIDPLLTRYEEVFYADAETSEMPDRSIVLRFIEAIQ